jgi:hypothetical protein
MKNTQKEERCMCQVSAGKQVSQVNTLCNGGCNCPVTLPPEEEISRLEEDKKILKDRILILSTRKSPPKRP